MVVPNYHKNERLVVDDDGDYNKKNGEFYLRGIPRITDDFC